MSFLAASPGASQAHVLPPEPVQAGAAQTLCAVEGAEGRECVGREAGRMELGFSESQRL